MEQIKILYINFVLEKTCNKCKRSLGIAYVVKSSKGLLYYGSDCIKELNIDISHVPNLTRRTLKQTSPGLNSNSTKGGEAKKTQQQKEELNALSYLLLRQEILKDFNGVSYKQLEVYLDEFYSTGTLKKASVFHINNIESALSSNEKSTLALKNLLDCNVCYSGLKEIIKKTEGKNKDFFTGCLNYLKKNLYLTSKQLPIVNEAFKKAGLPIPHRETFAWKN